MDRNFGRIMSVFDGLVALRKESVDRNDCIIDIINNIVVALRKESVDRNFAALRGREKPCRRSPQGERG